MTKLPKLVSYNVRGLRNELKRRKIFNYLHQQNTDIAFLQETHSCENDERIWTAEWGGKALFSHGSNNARGVAILLSRESGYQIDNFVEDEEGRVAAISLQIRGRWYSIASLYAPNADDPNFFHEAFKLVDALDNQLKIIAGDFNTVLDVNMDLQGGRGFTNIKTREFLNEYMEQSGLIDIWRIQNPDIFRSTFVREKPAILKERLDYFLISSGLAQNVTKSDFLPKLNLSDHSAPYLCINFVEHIPGKGYWKFNITLLEDEIFCEQVKEAIREVIFNTAPLGIFETWEMLKLAIREKAIIRSSRLSKSRNNKIGALEHKLKQLLEAQDKADHVQCRLFQDLQTQIIKIQDDLNTLLEHKTVAAMLRSRASWYELGEKSSKYFHGLEKHNHNKKVITQIIDPVTNETKTEPQEISKVLTDFYRKLYSEKALDLDPDYLALTEIPQVKEEDKHMLNAPIQVEEIHSALKQLKKGKCCGVDGLLPELYIKFWPLLANVLCKLFNEIVRKKELHNSAKDGVLTLLEKPGKELLKVLNWRPITLLNTDYKLYAKVLANRLEHVLPYLIHEDQFGYMKGRNISNDILDLMSLINFCETEKQQAILISVDFQKAYDSLQHNSLREILKAYGFGEVFIEMIMLCYKDVRTAVMNNNQWSSWIKVKSGLRQGCTLSCGIFILAISIIGLRIKQNNNIRGIRVANKEKKLNQYVDDLWNVIKYEISSFQELLFEYSEFEDFTGLAINYDKTEILRIGSLRGSDAQFYSTLPLKWSDGPIKILGISVHPSYEEMLDLNYKEINSKIEMLLKTWALRDLTPVGKIQVVNSLCNSQFVYKLQCLPSPPGQLLANYKQIVRKFIWNGKKPKIAYKWLLGTKDAGGLQLRDLGMIDKSLKLAKMNALVKQNFFWTHVARHVLGVKKEEIPRLNMKKQDAKNIQDRFVADICSAWAEFNFEQPVYCNDILSQVIWYNSWIKIDNKCIMDINMYNAGVVKVVDLFNLDTGRFFTYEEFVEDFGKVVNFLRFYQITAAIPKKWKETLRKNQPSVQSNDLSWNDQFFGTKQKIPQFCYKQLQGRLPTKLNVLVTVWNNDLKTKLVQKDMQLLFKKINKITVSTKLRYFQYRILSKSLTTNVRVSKYNKEVKAVCSFCEEKAETIVHLFFECKFIQRIWKAVTKWLKYFHGTEVKLDMCTCILNNFKGRNAGLVNITILIVKFYVYRTKVQGEKLNFQRLIQEITKHKTVEKAIAIKNDKLYKYARKWDDFEVFQ